jgi:sterol desaturase/sphingolipid hydroxylase (fatty acid hydroxylase superfamily)
MMIMSYLIGSAPVLIFIIVLIIEHFLPLRKRKHPFLPRLLVNIAMTAFVFLIGSLVVKNAALKTSEWALGNGFGLIPLIDMPLWAQIVAGILLMDLTFYYWHWANHNISLLWRFHNVHHIDPDLDVSTSFRFHLVEILYSTAFRLLQVLVLGVAPLSYAIYGVVFMYATMFHHSNINLPVGFERLLNKIVVTPRMHGIHHSAVKSETNSNYSVIFRWWDWLHRTLVLNVPQQVIKIGVPAYQRREDNRLWSLLKMPFVSQRKYWIFEDDSLPQSNQRQDLKLTSMLV